MRSVLPARAAVAIGLLVLCGIALAAEVAQEPANETAERQAFMRQAIDDQNAKFEAALKLMMAGREPAHMVVTQLVPFADWDFYHVTSNGDGIVWSPNAGQTFRPVRVPPGFVTDLASIPRVFWQAMKPEGRYAYAAVVHDYLYWTQTRSRDESDQIFRMAMEDLKVAPATVTAIYEAVRAFGQSAWNTNARLKKTGECRFLLNAPNDLTIAWNDWKKRPNVFGSCSENTSLF